MNRYNLLESNMFLPFFWICLNFEAIPISILFFLFFLFLVDRFILESSSLYRKLGFLFDFKVLAKVQ